MSRFVLTNVEVGWFRLQGEPHQNYNKDGFEWSANFMLDKEHVATCRENGMAKVYLKEDDEGKPFIKFVKKAHKRDGSPAQPIQVVDRFGKPWDPNTLVGNGSKVDIIVMLNEMTTGPNQGKLKPYIPKVAVKELVEYIPDDGIEYETQQDVVLDDSVEDIGTDTAAEGDW